MISVGTRLSEPLSSMTLGACPMASWLRLSSVIPDCVPRPMQ
jgi:hypothetical protein